MRVGLHQQPLDKPESDAMAMSSESLEIWSERHAIEKARRAKIAELMEKYDKEVYYPAKKALVARCAEIGHVRSSHYHDNGLGWVFFYCNQCGAKNESRGPSD